jgi:uncharacterized membrane protein YkvA (DUF1232 family)
VGIADDEEIVGAARECLATMRRKKLPDFVARRLGRLATLIEMVTDGDWPLPAAARGPALAALAYLCDPDDLIPDDVPGLGLLDDAIMIELVCRELRHELDAYRDFAAYRQGLTRGRKPASRQSGIAARIARRRGQLVARMKRRKAREFDRQR